MSVHGNQKDAEIFAKALNAVQLGEKVKIGKFYLRNTPPAIRIIDKNDLLGSVHQYIFAVENKTLALTLKIILGNDDKYRLFAYTKVEDNEGIVLTMDVSTQRAESNIISLMQIIKFTERFSGQEDVTKTDRKHKQAAMSKILTTLGFHVTVHSDLLFGQFDTDTGQFLGTKADRFLIDIVLVALLKGHLQGNKGYQLEVFEHLE